MTKVSHGSARHSTLRAPKLRILSAVSPSSGWAAQQLFPFSHSLTG